MLDSAREDNRSSRMSNGRKPKRRINHAILGVAMNPYAKFAPASVLLVQL